MDIESTVKYTYEEAARINPKYKDYDWNYVWLSHSWVQMARTQASDFGWDWSPAIAPQGIYGEVEIVKRYYEMSKTMVETRFEGGIVKVDVYGQIRWLDKTGAKDIEFEARILSPGEEAGSLKKTIKADKILTNTTKPQKFLLGTITVSDPRLWYPIGYGPQNLYTLESRSSMASALTQA